MAADAVSLPPLEFHPLTPERWNDLEKLFGETGGDDGCWCMWWRLTRARFEARKGEGNKGAMRGIVESGQVPGILAYTNGQPIAWCSLGPRESYPRLNRSPKLRRVDAESVWSIVCFYVSPPFRGRGLMLPFLTAALEHARSKGAKIVEGYPVEPERLSSPVSGYMGIAPAFREAGFVEVLRRSEHQPIMRYIIAPTRIAAP